MARKYRKKPLAKGLRIPGQERIKIKITYNNIQLLSLHMKLKYSNTVYHPIF
jgi:hypothetical protein